VSYIVYNYPPNRHRTEDFRDNRREFRSLDEARREVKKRLGELDLLCHWTGYEPRGSGLIEVEAYHESDRPGCGGVQISMPIKFIQVETRPAL
jgi:hypothetical protein